MNVSDICRPEVELLHSIEAADAPEVMHFDILGDMNSENDFMLDGILLPGRSTLARSQ